MTCQSSQVLEKLHWLEIKKHVSIKQIIHDMYKTVTEWKGAFQFAVHVVKMTINDNVNGILRVTDYYV